MSSPSDLRSELNVLYRNYIEFNRPVGFLRQLIPLLEKARETDIYLYNRIIELLPIFLRQNGLWFRLKEEERERLSVLLPALKTLGHITDENQTGGVYGIYIDPDNPKCGFPFSIRLKVGGKSEEKPAAYPATSHMLSQFEAVRKLNFWHEKKLMPVHVLQPCFDAPSMASLDESKVDFTGDSAELAMFVSILFHFQKEDSPLKRQKFFATGRIHLDGTVGSVDGIHEKIAIMLEEHPDLDWIYIPVIPQEHQKVLIPPTVRLIQVSHIGEIWEQFYDQISPVWLAGSLFFINQEIRFLRELSDLQKHIPWIKTSKIRERFRDLIALGKQYMENDQYTNKNKSIRELTDMAMFYKHAGYFYNHFDSLTRAKEMYDQFLLFYRELDERKEITGELLHGLNQIAVYYRDIYDYTESTALLDRVMSSRRFSYLPETDKAAWYRTRALVAMDMRDFDRASHFLKKSRKIVRSSQDSLVRQLDLEMELYCKTGNYRSAAKIYRELREIFLQNPWDEPFILQYLLKFLVAFGKEMEPPVSTMLEELVNREELLYDYLRGILLHWFARYLFMKKQTESGIRILGKSTETLNRVHSPDTDLLALGNLWLEAYINNDISSMNNVLHRMKQNAIPSIRTFIGEVIRSRGRKPIIEFLHY